MESPTAQALCMDAMEPPTLDIAIPSAPCCCCRTGANAPGRSGGSGTVAAVDGGLGTGRGADDACCSSCGRTAIGSGGSGGTAGGSSLFTLPDVSDFDYDYGGADGGTYMTAVGGVNPPAGVAQSGKDMWYASTSLLTENGIPGSCSGRSSCAGAWTDCAHETPPPPCPEEAAVDWSAISQSLPWAKALSWKDLELSCPQLDQANVTITNVDIKCDGDGDDVTYNLGVELPPAPRSLPSYAMHAAASAASRTGSGVPAPLPDGWGSPSSVGSPNSPAGSFRVNSQKVQGSAVPSSADTHMPHSISTGSLPDLIQLMAMRSFRERSNSMGGCNSGGCCPGCKHSPTSHPTIQPSNSPRPPSAQSEVEPRTSRLGRPAIPHPSSAYLQARQGQFAVPEAAPGQYIIPAGPNGGPYILVVNPTAADGTPAAMLYPIEQQGQSLSLAGRGRQLSAGATGMLHFPTTATSVEPLHHSAAASSGATARPAGDSESAPAAAVSEPAAAPGSREAQKQQKLSGMVAAITAKWGTSAAGQCGAASPPGSSTEGAKSKSAKTVKPQKEAKAIKSDRAMAMQRMHIHSSLHTSMGSPF